MNKVIILGKDQCRLEIISTEWEINFEAEIHSFSNLVLCQRFCSENKNDVKLIAILNDFKDNLSTDLITSFSNIGVKAPIIIDNGKTFRSDCEKHFTNIGIPICVSFEQGYRKIPFYSFMAFNVSPCDLHIKLGREQFVKIINRDEIFSREILSKYKEKNIKSLYIKNNDLETYLKDYYNLLKHQHISRKSSGLQDEIKIASLKFISENLSTLEIENEVIDLAQETIRSILSEITNYDDTQKRINNFFNSGNFLAEHSLATSMICTALAIKMGLHNRYTINKLVIASLFHDIGIKEETLGLISSSSKAVINDLSEKRKREFKNHIQAALGFIEKLKDIPSNTGNIIWEHHELPDGTGFPRGLDSHSISPLSCIFIIAEDFYIRLHQIGFSVENRNKVLQEISTEYSRGNFKAPMSALLALFF